MKRITVSILILFMFTTLLAFPRKDKASKESQPFSAKTFSGLKFRAIGPALTSGRISDIAVHPQNR
ncbi:MAG: hypothetical protein ACE5HX_08150, partial [bacterium]